MPCCDCITRSLFLGCSDGGVQWHMRQLSSTDLVKLDSAGPAAEPVCGPVHKWHDCPWVCSVIDEQVTAAWEGEQYSLLEALHVVQLLSGRLLPLNCHTACHQRLGVVHQ